MFEVIKNNINSFLYRVEETDTLESISKKFNITINKIKKDNNIQEIYPGCVLYINTKTQNVYIVQPLDTIDGICKKLNVDKFTLINNNKITKLYIGQKLEY